MRAPDFLCFLKKILLHRLDVIRRTAVSPPPPPPQPAPLTVCPWCNPRVYRSSESVPLVYPVLALRPLHRGVQQTAGAEAGDSAAQAAVEGGFGTVRGGSEGGQQESLRRARGEGGEREIGVGGGGPAVLIRTRIVTPFSSVDEI